MRVLLLHPGDTLSVNTSRQRWDLIVDLARAPDATYDTWRRQAGCPVLGLDRFAEEVDDLRGVRRLLQLGAGRMLDRWGIDWWDVLCLEIAPQLRQLTLVQRLSKALDAGCELYASRPHPIAAVLQRTLGARLIVLENWVQAAIHQPRRYHEAFSRLRTSDFAQVIVDKFDNDHSIRRRFARRSQPYGKPVVLLPSAYVNVSRVALSYAELLPNLQFLLVCTRNNARVPALPSNVRSVSLTPYFVPSDKREIAYLLEVWKGLRNHLACSSDVFSMGDGVGLLDRIPGLLRWGLALRDAWSGVFESEDVIACLSGDDSNPPSSIPLIMAQKRGIPALACHHGALDYQMAIKTNRADLYLVKSEMEQDYLRRICGLAPEKMAMAPPSNPISVRRAVSDSAPWLVFFTEPYSCSGWRSDEVYRDLLPSLCSLAQSCGLKLVFKLHPFENLKSHRRMLRRFIPKHRRQIEVIAGPPSEQLWNNARVALTVQSSTALECATRGIPVFLCAWLRDLYSGYVQQYSRFGVGRVLKSAEQIAEIPALLENENAKLSQSRVARSGIEADELARLFSGTYSPLVASNA